MDMFHWNNEIANQFGERGKGWKKVKDADDPEEQNIHRSRAKIMELNCRLK